ncbi:hypothetical protein T230_03735, partial [Tannerella sp. oral taxon BU063 isolate Cell 1/3]
VSYEFQAKRGNLLGKRTSQVFLFINGVLGDVIEVRKPPVTFSFRVLDLTESRMGAPLVPRFMENVTPPEQYEILEMNRISGFVDRARGLGRPTKKERRDLEQFTHPDAPDFPFFDLDEDDDGE